MGVSAPSAVDIRHYPFPRIEEDDGLAVRLLDHDSHVLQVSDDSICLNRLV